jgi:hypothetical protein
MMKKALMTLAIIGIGAVIYYEYNRSKQIKIEIKK